MTTNQIGLLSLSDIEFDKDEQTIDELIVEEIKDYNINEFLPLVQILINKYNFLTNKENDFELDGAIFIIWKFLRIIAMDYYHNEFNKYFGMHFQKEELSFFDYIFFYTEINTIDPLLDKNISIFTYYLMKLKVISDEKYYLNRNKVLKKVIEIQEQKNLQNFEKKLTNNIPSLKVTTINDIDMMTGIEFEKFIAELFVRQGYSAEVTKVSGDQGIDVIIEKNGQKIGIQTKCYSGKVSNKAIQEVVAGLNYYKLDKGLVVTNNYFTQSAIELAESNNIVLWNREILKDKLKSIY